MNNSPATVSAAASSDDPSQWWKFWQWVCSAGVQKTDWQVLWQCILTVPSLLLLNLLTAVVSSVQTPKILCTVSCITVPATTGWHCKNLGNWLLQDKRWQIFHKVVWQHAKGVDGAPLLTSALQIYCCVLQWKKLKIGQLWQSYWQQYKGIFFDSHCSTTKSFVAPCTTSKCDLSFHNFCKISRCSLWSSNKQTQKCIADQLYSKWCAYYTHNTAHTQFCFKRYSSLPELIHVGDKSRTFFVDSTSLLSPKQQCHRTEGNAKAGTLHLVCWLPDNSALYKWHKLTVKETDLGLKAWM